jgi:phage replication O-like protein O
MIEAGRNVKRIPTINKYPSDLAEDGFLYIPNEILDVLGRSAPGGSEGQVLTAIIRLAYGSDKTPDDVTISGLEQLTRLSSRTVKRAVQRLKDRLNGAKDCDRKLFELAFTVLDHGGECK